MFKTLAILLPFLVLALVELFLQVVHYGYDTHLFIEDKTGMYFRFNPEVAQKYFTIQENATQGAIDLFPKEKKPGTIRLFVLGESTSVGFPYMHNGAFSRLLKYRLQFAYPDVQFEIINLSLTAVNSYTLYDFSKELVHYAPDGVLIYAGHNEYYGALGVASSSSVGRNPRWIRAALVFKELKIGQWLFRMAAKLKGADKKTTDYSLTLMERMAQDQSISYHSTLFQQGLNQFDNNMTDMLNLFSQHHIPVFISNLVCNLKDVKPFISSKDRLSADRQFLLATKAYAQKDYVSAKRSFLLAKEYDKLRFRAPERMNALIGNYAKTIPNVRLVDAVHEFEINSPHGILDSTLLLEHVHPNLMGQKLLSDAFFRQLTTSGLLPETKRQTFSLSIQSENYPFTAYDTLFGQISIWMLKELWPFNEPIPAENPGHVRSYEEQLAGACAVRQINWYESMRKLYDFYKQKKDFGAALRIMEGLCLEFPYDQEYCLLAGKLSFMQNKKSKALFYFNNAIEIAPCSEALALRNELNSSVKERL